jgi:beta-glucosidase
MDFYAFPDGFEWGAATAAYQIEGGAFEDGRGLSIWDVFCQQPGRVQDGDTGNVACDHYHRYRDDVALMRELGLATYRFSISWPRVIPRGVGESNEAGLDFYDRLVDELLDQGIRPCPTLYHWDLPQSLQDRGGWASRDTAHHFADYATLMFDRLGDRVNRWITHNEPIVTAEMGHRAGVLAPGIRDLGVTGRVIHHLLYSHGLGVQAFRASACDGEIGITHANTSFESADETDAVEIARDFQTRVWHGPVFGRGYPERVLDFYASKECAFPIEPGDLDVIAVETDFLGVNLYSRSCVLKDDTRSIGYRAAEPTLPLLPMGYEAAPHALGDFVRWVSAEYDRPKIYITENGVCDNTPLANGAVDDRQRVELLRGFLKGVSTAIDDGCDVRAYYVWSLMDNFEWAYGYSKRFGIVWTDFETQQRVPKASAQLFSEIIRRNGVEAN